MIHTNGMDTLRAKLKRAYVGVDHHVSGNYLGRHSKEFVVMRNTRHMGTDDRMGALVQCGVGKRLRLAGPIGPKPTRQSDMLNAWKA